MILDPCIYFFLISFLSSIVISFPLLHFLLFRRCVRSFSIHFCRVLFFNFLAHLLCALVIYLLSKLCCNKILTICFISSDPPSLPCLSFFYMFAVPFLIYFILFDSVVFALVFPFQYSLLTCLMTVFSLSLSVCFHFNFVCSFDFSLRALTWSINWWYCGNIEMSVFISFLHFIYVFFFLLLYWRLTPAPFRILHRSQRFSQCLFYSRWSVRKVLIIRILWVLKKTRMYARTEWNFMWTCLYRKLLLQPFFCCRTTKKLLFSKKKFHA